MGKIAAMAVVQLLFSTGKNFTVGGLRAAVRMHGPLLRRRLGARFFLRHVWCGFVHRDQF